MTEAEMRSHRCCFTGHRPEKLMRSKEQITKDLTQRLTMQSRMGIEPLFPVWRWALIFGPRRSSWKRKSVFLIFT
jgi:hypothetical protein